jgi:DNA-binding Lrp family transcriptional regulator
VDTRKLDAIDLRILTELQADGRITNVELSRRAKITAPPCLRRIRALEKAGFIRGYHAELDGKSLGFEVTGFVFVGLASQKDGDLKHFEESARRWPEVRCRARWISSSNASPATCRLSRASSPTP